MPAIPRIETCLWFDTQAEEAAKFYMGIFPNSKVHTIARYPATGQEIHGKPAGSVMTVDFELDGHRLTALNGGPHFKFTEAVSLMVMCDTQAEVDHYWDALGAGGDPRAQQCGWLKDRFGLSWQVVPRGMDKMMNHPDPKKRERAFNAIMKMKKLDIAELERAVAD